MKPIFDRIFKRKKKDIGEFNLNKNGYTLDKSLYESTYESALLVLKLCGLRLTRKDSPTAAFLWSAQYWFIIFNIFYSTILEVLHMVEVGKGGTFEDAVAIFTMMPCVGYLIMSIVKSYKIFTHRPVFENLISELRSMWPTEPVTKEEYDLVTKAIKRLNFINKVYFWCDQVLLALFLIPCLVNDIMSWLGYDIHLQLPFLFWLPFDPYKRFLYDFLLLLQSWDALNTVWLILCCDFLFYTFMCHISTQFELLAIRIRKLVYVPTDHQLIPEYPLAQDLEPYLVKNREIVELNGPEDWEIIHLKEINAIILRHQTLIRLSRDAESMFSFQMLVNFINSSIIICFCGFCCVIIEKWNEFIYKTFLISALTQIGLFCYYGERLLESSASVGDALYKSGWYLTSKRIRSNVLIMIQRAQKQVHVTAYGFSVIGLTSYTTIIKTSWSYLTLLLNTYKK